jgi:hypothetical protein
VSFGLKSFAPSCVVSEAAASNASGANLDRVWLDNRVRGGRCVSTDIVLDTSEGLKMAYPKAGKERQGEPLSIWKPHAS